jgi:hypothetical protein
VLALLSLTASHPVAGCAGREQAVSGGQRSYVATVIHGARAYRKPGGAVLHSFTNVGINGGPQVFSVVGRVLGANCEAEWLRVQLPLRPNGLQGYVRAFAVRVSSVRTKVLVDMTHRRLTLLRGSKVILRAPVAIGTSATPTPKGRFYVKEALLTRDPNGAYGPGALGLSAYSPVLIHWAEGGPIGIHGTDQPSSIGHAASNGCIRVHNAVAVRLLQLVPLGTPVIVR